MKSRYRYALVILAAFGLSNAQAKSNVYKYAIEPTFTVYSNCTNDNEPKISQVRISIPQSSLANSKDIVDAEAKISACIIGGRYISKTMNLPLPKEILTANKEIRLGTRLIDDGIFRSIDVKKKDANTYEISFYTNQGLWDVINPVIVEVKEKSGNAPTKLQLKLVNKNMWINAKFRLQESE